MELDVSQEFIDFCNIMGIELRRNRKLNLPYEKLEHTAGVELKVKETIVYCKIYFGRNIKPEIVNRLFQVLPNIGKLCSLELINIALIPAEIEKLHSLKSLSIESKVLKSLPEEIKNLSQLTELSLRVEKLNDIPKWIISLKKLRILDLFGTKIKSIPDNINELINLEILDLCCTHIERMPKSILDLNLSFKNHFNEEDVPGIYFCDSTCDDPSLDIIFGDRKRLKFYFDSYNAVCQNEVRVILLGKKGSGKTSLVQRMQELQYSKSFYKKNNSWTQGISIKDIHCKNDEILHMWDFGGQEIMLSTHTLFLRDHCIYIIVLNARQGDEPDQWLDYINQYGKNSDVFIVNNHMDMADVSQIDINRLRRMYSDIKINGNRVWTTSCKYPDEFSLKEFYEQLKIAAKKYFEQKIAFSWHALNLKLGEMKKHGEPVNYITHDDYLSICENCGIIRSDEKNGALQWLNEIGTVFTYGNPLAIEKITEFKVLRPVWVTDAIYKVINNENFQKETCLISHEEIRKALLNGKSENKTESNYSNLEIGFILEIMRKFSLSFQFTEKSEFIPAMAKNEEFEEVADWVKNQDDTILDVVYNLSQRNRKRLQESSVNFTLFYQVIIKIVENYKQYPRMWRTGAIFRNIQEMEVLLFLQSKGKWDYEMRLVVRTKNSDGNRWVAASFHQSIFSFLNDFARNYKIDTKVLVKNNEDNHYFSIERISKILVNSTAFEQYDPEFDQEINYCDDVLAKIAPYSIVKLQNVVEQLRDEVREGNKQTDAAVHILQSILQNINLLQVKLMEYNDYIKEIQENPQLDINNLLQEVYNSFELKEKIQIILETCTLQEKEITIIRELNEELLKCVNRKGILEKIKKGLTALSTGVTLVTADYEKFLELFEIINNLVENVIKLGN